MFLGHLVALSLLESKPVDEQAVMRSMDFTQQSGCFGGLN